MPKTVITAGGIAAVMAASGGPQIVINKVHFGAVNSEPNAGMTGVPAFVYEASGAALRYSVRDQNSVVFRVTLDESVGDFTIGSIGLVLSNGTVFSISSLAAPVQKVKTQGATVGNRLSWSIPLVMSGIASVANLTVLVNDTFQIPEVTNQGLLPAANISPYNTYIVRQHSGYGNRTTFATAVNGTWHFHPEDLGAAALSETNVLTLPGKFDAGSSQGVPVWYDAATATFKAVTSPSTQTPRGIRGAGDTLYMGGSYYTHPSSIFTAGSTYYVQANGTLGTPVTDYEAGIAITTDKLAVTLGSVQGKPWLATTGSYSPAGRLKSMWLPAPAWWPSAAPGYGAATSFSSPSGPNYSTVYSHIFPKASLKCIEAQIPILKSMNKSQGLQCYPYFYRPAGSAGPDVVWSIAHYKMGNGYSINSTATETVGVKNTALNPGVMYKGAGTILNMSSYSNWEIMHLSLSRDGSNGLDNTTTDVNFVGMLLQYLEASDTDA